MIHLKVRKFAAVVHMTTTTFETLRSVMRIL